MEPEETTVEEVVEETTPEQQIQDFGASVTEKLAQVESGELAPEEFIDGCIAELEAIKLEMNEGSATAGPLGGLGGGEFNLPEPEEV